MKPFLTGDHVINHFIDPAAGSETSVLSPAGGSSSSFSSPSAGAERFIKTLNLQRNEFYFRITWCKGRDEKKRKQTCFTF